MRIKMANSDAFDAEFEDITDDDNTSVTNNEQNDENSIIEIDCLSSQTSLLSTDCDHISPQSLALITVKLGLLESKLNQTNIKVEEMKQLSKIESCAQMEQTNQKLSNIEMSAQQANKQLLKQTETEIIKTKSELIKTMERMFVVIMAIIMFAFFAFNNYNSFVARSNNTIDDHCYTGCSDKTINETIIRTEINNKFVAMETKLIGLIKESLYKTTTITTTTTDETNTDYFKTVSHFCFNSMSFVVIFISIVTVFTVLSKKLIELRKAFENIRNDFTKQIALKDEEIAKINTIIENTNTKLVNNKTDFAKQLAIKDKDIDRLNTKFSEFEALLATKLNGFDNKLENTNTAINSEFTHQLAINDEKIDKKFSEFDRSMTTKLRNFDSTVHNSLSETKTELETIKTNIDSNASSLHNQIANNWSQFTQIQQKIETRVQEALSNHKQNTTEELAKVLAESSPAATIAFFATSTPPTGWLKANGQHVSRTEYAKLFAMIGTQYGCGDASTTFTLPDLRGEFIRAWSDGRDGIDKDREFGSFQFGSSIPMAGYVNGEYDRSIADAYQHHWGFAGNTFDNGFEGDVKSGETRDGITFPGNYVAYVDANHSTGNITTWNVIKGTRPRNIALLACIKY